MDRKEFIGFYASLQEDRAIVNEDGSVIVLGNKDDFINYHENHPEKITEDPAYKKINYDEIMHSLYEGYSFAFDEISYNRFYPIARLDGFNFGSESFTLDSSTNYEKRFATLKIEPNQKSHITNH